ncbi:MAG: DUF2269 family protein [Candidatus Rickettsia vulgarisii]
MKTIHIISSTILFGTGIGTAFFMWWANKTGDLAAKAYAARTTVITDFLYSNHYSSTCYWLDISKYA